MPTVESKREYSFKHRRPLTNVMKTTLVDRQVKNMASGIFEQLRKEGCQPNDIINISSQLIEMISNEMLGGTEKPEPKSYRVSVK